MVWGSDEVVSAYAQFRRASVSNNDHKSPSNVMFRYENLILAIRKDLGHANKNFKQGDVLSLFINDIDEYTTG